MDHKSLDKKVYEVLSHDLKRQGLFWSRTHHRWLLRPEARVQARARGGYTMGQLVHYAREDRLMTLAPDDVTGVPFDGSASRQDCDVDVVLAERIRLPTPILSANMASVTDARLAITLARMGGMGVLHQFQSIDEQVAEVEKVKDV